MKSSVNNGLHKNEVIPGRKPDLGALRNDEIAVAVASKLVQSYQPKTMSPNGRTRGVNPPNLGMMERLSNMTGQDIADIDALFQMLPEMSLAEQLLVSSILSPNDMVSSELSYFVDGRESDGDLTASLLAKVEDYFNNSFEINKLLPDILRDALTRKGSKPIAVLPESSIDDAINGHGRVGMESFGDVFDAKGKVQPIGILGNETAQAPREHPTDGSISMEAFDTSATAGEISIESQVGKDVMLHVSDNPSLLKLPLVQQRIRQERVRDRYGARKLGLESYKTFRRGGTKEAPEKSEVQVEQMLYRTRNFRHVPVMGIGDKDAASRETVGHPLVMFLPSESVIPVHVPGNPEEHIGYFVLLDETGNPINRAMESDYYSQLSSNLNANRSQLSSVIQMSKQMQTDRPESDAGALIAEATRNYTEMVEASLIKRLRNGIYGSDVEIARPTEVYRIMLARTAARMQTRLLYIPDTNLTYIAFDYDKYGIGKSLVEDTKIIASIRAMLLLANTMAAIKNSTGLTRLELELDPEDPDPEFTAEQTIAEFARVRGRSYPLGSTNPLQLIDFIQSAGIDVAITGHPAYPDTKLEVSDNSMNRTPIDTELDEMLKKRHISAWGLSPETVDLSMDVDFATSIVASNINLTKRVMMYQNIFCPFLKDFMCMYIENSSYLMQALYEIAQQHLESQSKAEGEGDPGKKAKTPEELVAGFLERFRVALPSPNTVKLENQLAAFSNYNEALEMCLEAYVNEEMLDMSVLGESADAVPSAISSLRNYFRRQWLREHNVMPELEALIVRTENEEDNLNLKAITDSHLESIHDLVSEYLIEASKRSVKSDQEIDEARNPPEEEEEQA